MTARLSLIAAVAENGVIGAGGGLPWRVPSDMAFFKRTTLGKPILMGRKQFESVGRPLPGRINLVVTRQRGYQPDGVIVLSDVEAAVGHAMSLAESEGASEAMVIGGGEIYRQTIARADRLYISHVAISPDGDTMFPTIDPALWQIVAEPEVVSSPADDAPYRIAIYQRRA